MNEEEEKALQTKLNDLYQEQGVAFGALQRAISYAHAIEVQYRVPPIISSRTEHLQKSWTECVAHDKNIRLLAARFDQKERSYFKERKFENAEVEYINARDQLAIWLYAATSHTPTDPGQMQRPPGTATAADLHVKLERLSLPDFSGKFTEWAAFKDSFVALVKSSSTLTNIEKLYYLKSCVKGEAQQIIRNVQLVDANFDIAWESLESRFSNKRAEANSHFAEIFNLESMKKESAANLLYMRNVVKQNLAALKNLGCPTEHYGAILIYLLNEKLDARTQRDWEVSIAGTVDLPSYDTFDKFLVERIRVLESISHAEASSKNALALWRTSNVHSQAKLNSQSKFQTASKPLAITSYVVTQPQSSCLICDQEHKIYQCTKFKEMPVSERYSYIMVLRLCLNCLTKGHQAKTCPSPGTCRQCNKRHHTLLHRDTNIPENPNSTSSNVHLSNNDSDQEETSIDTHFSVSKQSISKQVVLGTAKIWISSSDTHRKLQVRALIDPGSTGTFASAKVAAMLGAKRTRVSASMSGLSGWPAGVTSSAINLNLLDNQGSLVLSSKVFVIPRITSYSNQQPVNLYQHAHFQNLQFADDLSSSEEIHMLIGADLYGTILIEGLRKGNPGEPIAQKTVYGWVVLGPMALTNSSEKSIVYGHHATIASNLDVLLHKFWEVESLPVKHVLSPDDEFCESYFATTHSRTPDGRYMVRIPFKSNESPQVGQSRFIAERLLKRVETRLKQNVSHRSMYENFMQEYEFLQHISPLSHVCLNEGPSVYLPHYPIFRDQSQTTKLRVVFNASSKTSNGTSINDHMLTGPKLQSELFIVLSQWRSYPLVFIADVEKMYRQILVDPRDRDFQRILWRKNPDSPPTDYQLNTVTYGTKSAPYLALRVVKQLVEDEGDKYPHASSVLINDTFVDDLLFGASDINDALKIRNEVIELLGRAHLTPRKWASNDPKLISDIDPTNHGLALTSLSADDGGVKVLGIHWSPKTDTFQFQVHLDIPTTLTKRAVLSILSKLFDPLGWVSPVIVQGKILMQKVWLNDSHWDQELPVDLAAQWLTYFNSLSGLCHIVIPRWNGFSIDRSAQLHGFADASEQAYGAVVYLRTQDASGQVTSSLIISKTKVAPLKKVNVHRLELQAALLLAQLLSSLNEVRAFSSTPIQCWSDSSIVLSWLKKHASAWKLFVSNRVAAIHELLPDHKWRHVPTASNPADIASRGSSPQDLVHSTLWWKGPNWLTKEPRDWPNLLPNPPQDSEMEQKIITVHVTDVTNMPLYIVAHKFSSWERAVRVTAYLLRYVKNLHTKSLITKGVPLTEVPPLVGSHLTSEEIVKGKVALYKYLQAQMFATELRNLHLKTGVSPKSKISFTISVP